MLYKSATQGTLQRIPNAWPKKMYYLKLPCWFLQNIYKLTAGHFHFIDRFIDLRI